MKTLYSLFAITLLVATNASAQTTAIAETNEINDVSAQSQNDELPVVGVRYYYYPNLDAYFDTHDNVYLYEKEGQWVKGPQIASGYRGYSLYNNTRFEITDYNGDQPYTKLSEHRKQFPKKFSSKRQPPKPILTESKVAYN